jgi:cytochrome c2
MAYPALLAAGLLVLPLLAGVPAGCAGAAETKPSGSQSTTPPIEDTARGRELIGDIGCGSCHVVPGVPGASGMVGPPLNHMGQRQIIAGMLHNTPDNMVQWLRFPQKVVPGNAMPDMGLTEDQARAISAYLLSLK